MALCAANKQIILDMNKALGHKKISDHFTRGLDE
jgi:hypothetical protein